jgi:tetratricopeptide (TPR) repeat protein
MHFAVRLALVAVLATPLYAASPRISFERAIPAPHAVRGDQLALIYALGDSPKLATFVDVFLDETNRAALHVSDATRHRQHNMRETADAKTIAELHRHHPSDVYLGIKAFTCSSEVRSGEGSLHDEDGKRVKQRRSWVDAVCEARIDVIDAEKVRRLYSFPVRGEGKSPRVAELTDEERDAAVEQAARRAAINAAESITPRRVRETIALDETAPLFDEGMAMIDAGRFDEARTIWQRGLRLFADSPGLHFNLAAVSEALGDVEAARKHFGAVRKTAAGEPRYRTELEMFRRRNRF